MSLRSSSRGFSLVELLVAVAIMVAVAGSILALTHQGQTMFQAAPERADMQQRVRIAVEAISKDLVMAGAGGRITGGAIVPGRTFATVLPFRRGLQSPDPPGTFFDDRLSTIYVPPSGAETTLSASIGSTVFVPVRPQPGCPATSPLCGFRAGQLVAVFDETGAYDTFRVSAVQESPPALIGAGSSLSKVYGAGAMVEEIVAATYWLQRDTGADLFQLMRYDGRQTDSPVADNIAGLRFEYFGDPAPPVLRRPLEDAQGPWTSYGPRPPPAEMDDVTTPGYAAGENCVFTVDDGATITRPEMRDLGSSGSSLVRLDPSQLTDGPWCPDPASPVRFDADLLRIRRVRFTLKVRASRALLVARIPDVEISTDVAPRNIGP